MSSDGDVAPTQTLSIFLVKRDKPLEDLIEPSHSPQSFPIQVGAVAGRLFTEKTDPHPPSWISFFGSAIGSSLDDLKTASASALLVVPMANRTFAVAFGYGRHMLNPTAIEPAFGLRATLNSVDAEKIRSIDMRTFEAASTQTREQASKDTSIGDFGLNVERDLLRAVVGTPFDPTLGSRLSGKDSLTANCRATIDTLPEFLQAYLVKSLDTVYQKHFSWVDNILEVRDPSITKNLDETLLQVLREGGDSKMWLAIPELIEWSDVSKVSYSPAASAPRYDDVHLKDFLATTDEGHLSEEYLRRKRVCAWQADGDQIYEKWPVYRCLCAEFVISGATYILSDGSWYQVNKDFVEVIDEAVQKIPTSAVVPPQCNAGEHEGGFNERFAASITGACCVDAKLIQYGGGKSSVEFCDVYTPAKQMIHVKKYAGSSALSHLFAQGTVAGTAFVSDARFRKDVNRLLPPKLKIKNPSKKPAASDFEVAFMVASRSLSSLTLPFFSRVTLRNAHIQLNTYGYLVTLSKIQVA
ncbi:MAG TPA: TIGR04141 family sporadically distributed protein [Thermoanaerobaculia bacterium]|nr:TIGR04141 family sporadically distributed protein [Thermoanaerobaculia bacterium]